MKTNLASRSIALKQAEKYTADDFLLKQYKFGEKGFWDMVGDFIFIPKRAFSEGHSTVSDEISTKDGISVRFAIIAGKQLPQHGLFTTQKKVE